MPSTALKCDAYAGVAQLVEQLICNQPVVGSNPITSFLLINQTRIHYGWTNT